MNVLRSQYDGWSASPSSIAFDVPANGRKIVSTTVTAPDRSESRGELAITETSNELPADLHASLQLKGATVIGRSASTVSDLGNRATWAAPVVHLGSEHRIAIYQNVPLANLLFKGDDDLSANVSLSRLAE
ncbi:MAG: hypothetical protein P4L33_14110, partial [Capsulimonadaceae bacterium]|nr:hypothetical protein [Capsulimonadaceae bacterium]